MDNNISTILPSLDSSSLPTFNSSILPNETTFNIITRLLNGTKLYTHQTADLMEPEKYSILSVHMIIWTFTIVTYILAIPISVRIFRSKAYLNVVDYFSFHIILCSFIAWIPSLILLLYHWFQLFTLKFCRFHYVILSTNETVPILFILYMVVERFLYAYPSLKQKCVQLSQNYFIYSYAIFTWLFIMFIYFLASPFTQPDPKSIITNYTAKYCPYNYSKLRSIATAHSIIYFCLFVPALVLIGFVLRYFYILRGTNQIPTIQKLWTMRVTLLLSIAVFYDIYLYYLVHIAETYKSFFMASVLHSSFYLTQVITIACTEPYWLEMLFERCSCLCCMCKRPRRTITTPVAISAETEMNNSPFSSSTGHYSLVDNTVHDEFDQSSSGPEPTLRVVA